MLKDIVEYLTMQTNNHTKKYDKLYETFSSGGIAIFPTDTVMGIGCKLNNIDGIERIYQAKGRPDTKPIAVLISDIDMALRYFHKIDEELDKILDTFWPGKLTVVMQTEVKVTEYALNNMHEIGLRIPNHDFLRQVISKTDSPIVATSANISGDNPPTEFIKVDRHLLESVDFALDEDSIGHLPSTVIRYLGKGKFEYIRQGEVVI